jgi:hypothetical protein
MKRVEYFLASVVSVLVSASVTFGQDAVSLRLNSPLVAPSPPGGDAVFTFPSSYAPAFDAVVTLRIWDSLPMSDSGWAMATTGRPVLNFELPFQRLPFEVLPPWLDTAASGVAFLQIKFAGRDGVPFPPIPPVPVESGFAVAVPEPGTLVLLGVGTMTLLLVRRRAR